MLLLYKTTISFNRKRSSPNGVIELQKRTEMTEMTEMSVILFIIRFCFHLFEMDAAKITPFCENSK